MIHFSRAIRLQSASGKRDQDAAASRPVPDPRCLCGEGGRMLGFLESTGMLQDPSNNWLM